MPPHALVDINPCFEPVRWQGYVDFVREVLGHVHQQEEDESEYDPHADDDDGDSMDDLPDLEPIPLDDDWEPEYDGGLPPLGTDARVAFEELMEFLETL